MGNNQITDNKDNQNQGKQESNTKKEIEVITADSIEVKIFHFSKKIYFKIFLPRYKPKILFLKNLNQPQLFIS